MNNPAGLDSQDRIAALRSQVEASGLFDAQTYLTLHSDVAIAVDAGLTTALDHFLVHGSVENRTFNQFVDFNFYLQTSTDVAAAVSAGTFTAAEHFFAIGIQEERRINSIFDLTYYLNSNTDVSASVAVGETSGIQHYLQFGAREDRSATSYFGAILNRQSFQSLFETDIGASFDIQSINELTDEQVLDLVEDVGSRALDVNYYRIRHRASLESFYGISVTELSNEQISSFAFVQGERAGLARSSVNLTAYRSQFSAQLVAFYEVSSIDLVTEVDVESFALGAGLEQGLDVTPFLDLGFYRSEYSAALTARFGATVTDANVVDFVFGEAAQFVDGEFVRTLFGEELTSSGDRVGDLVGSELRRYLFTEGFDGDRPLSPFNLESYRVVNSTVLAEFFGVANASLLTQTQIRQFAVEEGWKFGISLAEFTGAEVIELYRSQNATAIAARYDLTLAEVNALDANIVLDFQFGGVSSGVDFAYVRDTFIGDVSATFGVTNISQVTDLQILSFIYEEGISVDGFNLSLVDFEGYRSRYTTEIASSLDISTREVLALDRGAIETFIFDQGASLGLDASAFLNVEYLQSTYAVAIAQTLNIEVSAVSQLSAIEITNWYINESRNIDIEFLRHEIETLSVGQQARLFSSLGIAFDATASITTEQVIQIAYSSEFQALFQTESFQFSAVNIDAYIESNFEAIYEFYFGAEVVLSERTRTTRRTAGGGRTTGRRSRGTRGGTRRTRRTRRTARGTGRSRSTGRTLRSLGRSLRTLRTRRTGTGTGTRRTRGTGTGTRMTGTGTRMTGTRRTGTTGTRRTGTGTGTRRTGTGTRRTGTRRTGTGTRRTGTGTRRTGTGRGTRMTGTRTRMTGTGTGRGTAGMVTAMVTGGVTVEVELSIQREAVLQLSREQIITFAFGRGTRLGIDLSEFVQVDFLRHAFEGELLATYEVSSTKEIDDRLVIDFVYGGLSSEIDYEFYRRTHAAELTAAFGLEIEAITDTLILEHAYRFGVDAGLDLAPIDEDEILLAQDSDSSGESTEIDLLDFVDINSIRQQFSEDLLTEYRVDSVLNISETQVLEYFEGRGRLAGGLNLSAAVDFEFYRTTYAASIAADFALIDGDSSGAISDLELFDYITGIGLEKGQNPSELVDFAAYRAEGSASAAALVAFYGRTSIEQVTFRETLEFMFSVGLEQGLQPSAQLNLVELRDRPDVSTALVEFYGATSVQEVTLTQTFNYVFGAGFEAIGSTLIA